MRIVWQARALQDFDDVLTWLDAQSARASSIVAERIRNDVRALRQFPRIGRPGRVAGTREFVVARTPYVVAYRLAGDDIEIVAVLHGARAWPEGF